MLLPARGVAAFGVAIRFASASIIRCRSADLIEVRSNFRLPRHPSMRRALAMPHSARSPPPSKRHSRLTVEGAVAIGNDSQGFMAKPCTPHPITRKGYATSVRQQSCQRLCNPQAEQLFKIETANVRGRGGRPLVPFSWGYKGGLFSFRGKRIAPLLPFPCAAQGNHCTLT